MRDLKNRIKISSGITPRAITAGNATLTSSIIDRAGYDSLVWAIHSGVLTDSDFTLTVYEGDASNMSDETAVADADLIGTEAAASFADTDDSTVKKIGVLSSKRYSRIKLVQANATTGGFISAVAIQGHAKTAPVS